MLTFLYGPDTFRSQEKLLSIREQFLARHPHSELRTIDAQEVSDVVGTLSQSIRGGSLFSPHTFVSIQGLFSLHKADRDAVTDFFAKEYFSDESVCVVVRETTIDKRARLFKILKKNADEVGECLVLEGPALEKWAREYQKKHHPHLQFSPDAWREFLIRTGADLFRLTSEMQKLALIFGEEVIAIKDVRQEVANTPSSVIFELLDALSLSDRSRALSVVEDQYAQGSDAYAVLGMLAYHARTVASIVSVYEEEGTKDSRAIAKIAKVHPFVVEKTLHARSRFGLERAKNMIGLLSRLDVAAKTGKIDAELAVEEVILRA